jgi:hypothetical protein
MMIGDKETCVDSFGADDKGDKVVMVVSVHEGKT